MSELDFDTDFDIFDARQSQNSWALARNLRRDAPVSRIHDGFVYVARYEDCRTVFRDQETYSNAGGLRPTGTLVPLEDSSVGELVAPMHAPVRKLATVASQGGNVAKRASPFARQTADELLDGIVKHRKAELMGEFSLPLTNRVIAWLLGVPIRDAAKLSQWGEEIMLSTLTATNETERGVGYKEAFPEFTEYLESLIKERIGTKGPDDTVKRIVKAGLEGAELTVPLIRMVLMNLVLGGTATTRDLLGNLLLEVLTNPELHAKLRDQRGLVPAAVEESLRLSPPVLYLIRTCVKPSQLGGIDIKPGERVVIGIASANRDEEVFPDAESFRIDRVKPAGHLSFGVGQHFCVGAPLARTEAVELLNAFLDRFEPGEIRLIPGFELEWMPMPYMLGPKRLDVEII